MIKNNDNNNIILEHNVLFELKNINIHKYCMIKVKDSNNTLVSLQFIILLF
jgi:hypothetical protein